MKIVLELKFLICLLVFGFGVEGQVPHSAYHIKGHLKGLRDGTLIYLTCNSDSVAKILDTLAIDKSKGERFEFRGALSDEEQGKPYFISLDTLDVHYKHLKSKNFTVYLENSHNIKISGDIHHMGRYSIDVKGSGVHTDMISYCRTVDSLFSNNVLFQQRWKLLQKKYIRLLKDSSGDTREELKEAERAFFSVREAPSLFCANWVRAHLNSLVAPRLLLNQPDSVQSIYWQLAPRIQNSYFGRMLKAKMDRDARVAIGQKAPELVLSNTNGDMLSLHAIAEGHKLTIIEFWASWCGPCRSSFPGLKELYSRYKGKGLAIYGVAIYTPKEDWLKALDEDKLPWYNVIMPGASKFDSPAKELYGVSAVPSSFLLDNDGKILLRWAGGKTAELKTYLSQL